MLPARGLYTSDAESGFDAKVVVMGDSCTLFPLLQPCPTSSFLSTSLRFPPLSTSPHPMMHGD